MGASDGGSTRGFVGGLGIARMNTRLLHTLLCAGVLTVAIFSALTYTASADTQTIYVRLASGQVVPVTVDVPPGASLNDIQLPGHPGPRAHDSHRPDHPGQPPEAQPAEGRRAHPRQPGRQPPEAVHGHAQQEGRKRRRSPSTTTAAQTLDL